MKDQLPQPSRPSPATEATGPSRRAFLVSALSIGGALAGGLLYRRAAAAAGANPSSGSPAKGASATGTVLIVQFAPNGSVTGKVTLPKVVKTADEWKRQLSPISYEVTRLAGTERPYSGATWNNHERGIYHCVCCEVALFHSDTKFESGTGWPSFFKPIARENVADSTDDSIGMVRTAVSCPLCDAHLGHVFDDGPAPTGLRYCMNSAAMHFIKLA